MGDNASTQIPPEETESNTFLGCQRKNTTHAESLFLKEELSDVKVLIRSDSSIWRFPCHRTILDLASNVFGSMYNGNDQIIINDVKPNVFKKLLMYIYLKKVELEDWKIALEVFKAAHRFEIQPLAHRCEIYMLKYLTLRNVCNILDICNLYGAEKLKEHCLELCKAAGFVVLRTEAFGEVKKCTVELIVSIQCMNVRNEMNVFDAVWEWSKNECIRNNRPPNENEIMTEFRSLAIYIGFQFMSDKQKEILPDVVKNCEFQNNKIVKGRTISLPLKLSEHYDILEFISKEKKTENFTEGGFVTAAKFCLDADVYLISFILICQKVDAYKYIESLHIEQPGGIVLSWSKANNTTPIKIKLAENQNQMASTTNETKVNLITFEALTLISLSAGIEYTLVIEQVKMEGNFLKWPEVLPIEAFGMNDIEFSMTSKHIWGLKNMTFLKEY